MPPKGQKIPTPSTRVSTRVTSPPKNHQAVEANTSRVMKKSVAPKKAVVAKKGHNSKESISCCRKKGSKSRCAQEDEQHHQIYHRHGDDHYQGCRHKESCPSQGCCPKSNKRKATEDIDEPAAKPSKKARAVKPIATAKKPTAKAAAKPALLASKPKAEPKTKAENIVKPKVVKPKVIINTAPTQLLDIYVFGCNEQGELGLGLQTKKTTIARPVKNPDLTARGIVQMAAGGMHGAALTKDNKILTWGVNDGKPLGRSVDEWVAPERDADAESDDESTTSAQNPLESTPTEVDMTNVPEGTIFTQIAAGDNATYAVTNDGSVYGWGSIRGADGPMGFTRDVNEALVPMLIPGLTKIVKIAAGNNHYLALNNKGAVFAWGAAMVDIFCGSEHSFALHKNGTVYSWGANNMGQCGQFNKDGTLTEEVTSNATKVDILQGKNIKMMAAGNASSLALTKKARNESNQRSVAKTPIILPFKGSFIAVGSDHSIVLGQDCTGGHHSWGFNTYNQTGLEDDEDTIYIADELENKHINGKKLVWAAGGGQFTFLAGASEN
ncbi:hypothetical protein DID88_005262 [Monilinia fructigena]|uniref:RCC1-like domain-containing protein n=1 Tax=Monilinia fructigena TaxID=38457 RepID=A0A395IZA3_9HELO|nr:hypothetical protein DID88_005262 [Monilinia fructigena]